MYRVRKTWANAESQLGAYDILDNAKKKADANPGYTVYDESGNPVYPTTSTATESVRTMRYKAKLVKPLNGYKKGKKLTVTRDLKKRWVSIKGMVIPDCSYLDLTKQIYDNTCRYNRATAENFVNSNGWGSETGWLIWCNKWGQRVYIFKGSKKKWKLYKVRKCGTGSIADGDHSDQGVGFNWKIYDKNPTVPATRGGLLYWAMHYTSLWGNCIHTGTVGKPSTHGCIALTTKACKWVYKNVPINTRVIVF